MNSANYEQKRVSISKSVMDYFKYRKKMPYPYRIRAMMGTVIIELICIIVFQFWPVKDIQNSKHHFIPSNPLITHLNAPPITVQSGSKIPPSPIPPVPVPNDQPIKEKIVLNSKNLFSGSGESSGLAKPGGTGNGNEIVSNPTVAPSVTRIVEPTYHTNLDQKYLIKVKFLVNKRGRVEKATIVAIYVLDKNGNRKKEVEQINPKVKKAVLKAASNWLFDPAKNHGKPVKAYTKNYFTV